MPSVVSAKHEAERHGGKSGLAASHGGANIPLDLPSWIATS
jgi:hypothetical protein